MIPSRSGPVGQRKRRDLVRERPRSRARLRTAVLAVRSPLFCFSGQGSSRPAPRKKPRAGNRHSRWQAPIAPC